jgi:hypothetical protein
MLAGDSDAAVNIRAPVVRQRHQKSGGFERIQAELRA